MEERIPWHVRIKIASLFLVQMQDAIIFENFQNYLKQFRDKDKALSFAVAKGREFVERNLSKV